MGLSMKTDAGRVSSRGEDAGVSPAQLLKDRGLSIRPERRGRN